MSASSVTAIVGLPLHPSGTRHSLPLAMAEAQGRLEVPPLQDSSWRQVQCPRRAARKAS